ncbi:MAG TPA: LLM class flavin-dependent oxidoreductase [Candidatus Dormibacteraeota bacterium]|nr:LLM class flavin-dependent oxidoreductase [Candidatus Dormibacteraeota bacterium]
MSFTLPNRGVLFGVTTVDEMLELSEEADRSGLFDAIWVGDSLLGKPRLESISLLAAVAARTRTVQLGPACMASYPLRDPVLLAYQWASLDLISGGRTILIGCTGLVEQHGARIEGELYGLAARDRVRRLIEWTQILRRLWTEDDVTFSGEQYRFEHVSIEPKPAARPHPPIWFANNAYGERERVVRTLRRAAIHADGWQTSVFELDELGWRIPEMKRLVAEAGKDPARFPLSIYHNVNINEDREDAIEESRRFLDTYYQPTTYSREEVEGWVAHGSPDVVVEHLRRIAELGATQITLRITSFDQRGQFKRLTEEVLPRFYDAVPGQT